MAIIAHICRAYARDEESLQDLIQEVSLQLWRSHQSFEGKSQKSTWVYRVTLNVCLSQAKKLSQRVDTIPLEYQERADQKDETEKEKMDKLQWAIRQLNESDRAVILLYLEDKSYKEMSDILGITVSNVGVKVTRLKDKLKTLIHG
ncbi:MAG: RNA polymerase sigma-70 factor (ECF subfamily) [Cyclobacteriaceae bacterium]|jgi:RNA polymerase sigma-70 factor (ECF subfamily)